MTSTLPRPKRSQPQKYGETKNRYQFMLTETASEKVDRLAETLGITRSECLERLIRSDCVELIKEEA